MDIREITDCPYYLVTRASLAATAFLKRELAAAGLGRVRPAYLGVLYSLWIDDGQKAVDLGRSAGLEPSTMTGLLDRMEVDGLVVRAADPDDRRAQRISLTPEGRKAKDPVLTLVSRALDHLFDGVPERELKSVKSALRRLLANTDKIG